MVMNAKKFLRPDDGKEMFAGNGYHKPPDEKTSPSHLKSQSRSNSGSTRTKHGMKGKDQSLADKKDKDSQMRSQKQRNHKAEVQKTARRVSGDWSEHLSSSGKIYYYNCRTEVSRWEKPADWVESSPEFSATLDSSKDMKKKPKFGPSKSDLIHSKPQQSRSLESPNSTFPSPVSIGAFHGGFIENHRLSMPDDVVLDCRAQNRQQTPGSPFHTVAASSASSELSHCVQNSPRNPVRFHESPMQSYSDHSSSWSPSIVNYSTTRKRRTRSSEENHCYDNTYEDMDISPQRSPVNSMVNNVLEVSNGCEAVGHLESSSITRSSLDHKEFSYPLQSDNQSNFSHMSVFCAVAALREMAARTTIDGLRPTASWEATLTSNLNCLGEFLTQPFQTAEQQHLLFEAVQILQNVHMQGLWPQHQQKVKELLLRLQHMLNAGFSPSVMLSSPSPSLKYSNAVTSELKHNSALMLSHVAVTSSNHMNDGFVSRSLDQSTGFNGSVVNQMPLHLSDALKTCVDPVATFDAMTSSLAKYIDNRLTQHVTGWASETTERQANRAAEDAFVFSSLHGTQVSVELKRLRSLVRSNEIIAIRNEQRAASLEQHCRDLVESSGAQCLSIFDN